MPTEGAIVTVWAIALVVAVIVVAVVGVLLALILRTARQIDGAAATVWAVGQRIANATVHIPLLGTTNRIAGGILERVAGIDAAAAAIEGHASGCPSCPACAHGGATT
jgi:uncharacterized protein YoxC